MNDARFRQVDDSAPDMGEAQCDVLILPAQDGRVEAPEGKKAGPSHRHVRRGTEVSFGDYTSRPHLARLFDRSPKPTERRPGRFQREGNPSHSDHVAKLLERLDVVLDETGAHGDVVIHEDDDVSPCQARSLISGIGPLHSGSSEEPESLTIREVEGGRTSVVHNQHLGAGVGGTHQQVVDRDP